MVRICRSSISSAMAYAHTPHTTGPPRCLLASSTLRNQPSERESLGANNFRISSQWKECARFGQDNIPREMPAAIENDELFCLSVDQCCMIERCSAVARYGWKRNSTHCLRSFSKRLSFS